jgi:hypothetical protein
LKTGVEAPKLDIVPIIIGALAILVGAGGLYVFGMRDNSAAIQPSTSARQLPISQAPSQLGPNRYMYGRQYPQYPQQPPRGA